ncbi:hypothetical protein ASE98_18650 [Pseudomonas sp. Leaf48]|jgi:hypothetical protein|nr:hypothetical protein ASE98_18650 [Pseudomonas sp. Leaf48]
MPGDLRTLDHKKLLAAQDVVTALIPVTTNAQTQTGIGPAVPAPDQPKLRAGNLELAQANLVQ